MNSLLYLLATTLALAAASPAQSLGTLQKGFMDKYDALNRDRDGKLEQLETNYAAALTRLLDDSKRTGNLDAVLPVRDEISAVESHTWPLKELPKTAPRQLVEMRAKFVDARNKTAADHATELVALVDRMQQLLKDQEAELTRKGDIEAALTARKMAETLDQDATIQAARTEAHPKRVPSITEADWISLQKFDMQVIEKSNMYCEWVTERFLASLSSLARGRLKEAGGSAPILAAHAPATVEFRTKRPITRFRCRIFLASEVGDVAFTIIAGDKRVRSVTLSGKVGGRELSCEFPETTTLRLVTDPRGSMNSDHSAWIDPQVQ